MKLGLFPTAIDEGGDIVDNEELIALLNKLKAGVAIANPKDLERLSALGFKLQEQPKLSVEESIDTLFEARKAHALEWAMKLPSPPPFSVPSIQSLYNEIQECIIFGLHGAAITLSGILVEFALKYATYIHEVGGHANYNPSKWDEFEKTTFGPAINRAVKAGLVNREQKKKLIEFKDTYRNPYNHYNIRKITMNIVAGNVSILNLSTGMVETRDIAAKDDPVIQAQVKPWADQEKSIEVFAFADNVVKALLAQIDSA